MQHRRRAHLHRAAAQGDEFRCVAPTADAADAARLRLAPGRPLIVVDSVDVTPDGRPILTTRARFAADRIELVIELMVLISDTASAPPRCAARAATRMSVMFGVSLTITGSEQ